MENVCFADERTKAWVKGFFILFLQIAEIESASIFCCQTWFLVVKTVRRVGKNDCILLEVQHSYSVANFLVFKSALLLGTAWIFELQYWYLFLLFSVCGSLSPNVYGSFAIWKIHDVFQPTMPWSGAWKNIGMASNLCFLPSTYYARIWAKTTKEPSYMKANSYNFCQCKLYRHVISKHLCYPWHFILLTIIIKWNINYCEGRSFRDIGVGNIF